MAGDLIASLLTQVAGGASAAALDRYKPEWTYHVGGQVSGWGAAGDPAGVAITPGLMASVGLVALLAFLPGKITGGEAKGWKMFAANLAGGGLVVEGVRLAEAKVVPYIEQQLGVSAPGALPPGTPVTHGYPRALAYGMAMPYVGHVPANQPSYMHRTPGALTQYEIQQNLAQLGRVAA